MCCLYLWRRDAELIHDYHRFQRVYKQVEKDGPSDTAHTNLETLLKEAEIEIEMLLLIDSTQADLDTR